MLDNSSSTLTPQPTKKVLTTHRKHAQNTGACQTTTTTTTSALVDWGGGRKDRHLMCCCWCNYRRTCDNNKHARTKTGQHVRCPCMGGRHDEPICCALLAIAATSPQLDDPQRDNSHHLCIHPPTDRQLWSAIERERTREIRHVMCVCVLVTTYGTSKLRLEKCPQLETKNSSFARFRLGILCLKDIENKHQPPNNRRPGPWLTSGAKNSITMIQHSI